MASPLHLDREPEFDVARGLSTADSPVFYRSVPDQNGDVIAWDTEVGEAIDDARIQAAFGVDRSSGETVDRHHRRELWLIETRGSREAVRQVGQESNVLVLDRDSEGIDQGVVHGIDDRDLLGLRVLAAKDSEYSRRTSIVECGMHSSCQENRSLLSDGATILPL